MLSEIARPPTMEDAEPILERAGWFPVGTGYYGSVYAKEGVNYVLKLFDYRDRGYSDFLRLVQAHPNKHFPTIRGKPLRITPKYWAVRMEKLLPADHSFPNVGVYLFTRDHGPHPGNQPQVEADKQVKEYLEKRPDLKQALDLIIDHLLPKYSDDLHRDNFMVRADGTLVIIDPVGGGNGGTRGSG